MSTSEKWVNAILAIVVLALGFYIVPLATTITLGLMILVFLGVWPLVIGKKVPWWMWRQDQEAISVPRGDEEKKIVYERTVIFGLIEVRHIPQNVIWITRTYNADSESLNGYTEYGTGWHWICLPELFNFNVGLVDLRPVNLDPMPFEVNTGAGEVKIDIQGTFRITRGAGNATKFLVRAKEPIKELMKSFLTGLTNYITQAYSDIELIRLSPKDLTHMASSGTLLLNEGAGKIQVSVIDEFGNPKRDDQGRIITREETITIGRIGKNQDSQIGSFDYYGLTANIRIENLDASKEVRDALSRHIVARTDTQTFEEFHKRINKLIGSGIKPEWALIAEYLRPMVETMGKGTFSIPGITGKPRVEKSGKKESSADKNEGKEK